MENSDVIDTESQRKERLTREISNSFEEIARRLVGQIHLSTQIKTHGRFVCDKVSRETLLGVDNS